MTHCPPSSAPGSSPSLQTLGPAIEHAAPADPAGARVCAWLRAGPSPERTTRTLAALAQAGIELRVVLEVAPGNLVAWDPEHQAGRYPHPIEARQLPDPHAWPLPPQLSRGELLLLLEDGCEPPPGFATRLLAHLKHSGGLAQAVAASTNRAAGEAAIEPIDATRFGGQRPWRTFCDQLDQVWPGVHEDCAQLDTPALLLEQSPQLEQRLQLWVERRGALELDGDGRLLLARDVAVWRAEDLDLETQICVRVVDREFPPAEHSGSLAQIHERERLLLHVLRAGAHPMACLELAELYSLIGSFQRGVEYARLCLNAWPRQIDAQLCQVEHSLHEALAGSCARARVQLQAILDQGPLSCARRARLLACLGESWRRQGDSAQAQECFESSLSLGCSQELAHSGLARIELESGEFDSALARLLASARRTPLRAETWSNLGRALAMAGDNSGARSMLARSLSINPAGREARLLLGRLSASGKSPERDESTRQAVELLGLL